MHNVEATPFSKEETILILIQLYSEVIQTMNNVISLQKEEEQDQAVNHKRKLHCGSCSRSSCWISPLTWGGIHVKKKVTHMTIQGIPVPSTSPIYHRNPCVFHGKVGPPWFVVDDPAATQSSLQSSVLQMQANTVF